MLFWVGRREAQGDSEGCGHFESSHCYHDDIPSHAWNRPRGMFDRGDDAFTSLLATVTIPLASWLVSLPGTPISGLLSCAVARQDPMVESVVSIENRPVVVDNGVSPVLDCGWCEWNGGGMPRPPSKQRLLCTDDDLALVNEVCPRSHTEHCHSIDEIRDTTLNTTAIHHQEHVPTLCHDGNY